MTKFRGGKGWIREEVEDILRMYIAMETANPDIEFLGFDTEGEGASAEPYEGEHHICAEFYRDMGVGPKNWPSKSHGRHLRMYREMLDVWKQLGSKDKLTRPEARQVELCITLVPEGRLVRQPGFQPISIEHRQPLHGAAV